LQTVGRRPRVKPAGPALAVSVVWPGHAGPLGISNAGHRATRYHEDGVGADNSSGGIGNVVDSDCHTTLEIHQRAPSQYSSMLFTPRERSLPSRPRRVSYVESTCTMLP